MHIGIDVRPLQLDAFRDRGIGRHLRSWLEAAQSLETPFTFSLLFDPNLSSPKLNLSAPQWQLQALELPFGLPKTSTVLHVNPDEELAFDSAVEAFLLENKIDLFHATHMLMWEAFASRRLYHTRWLATIYDLIPLLFYDDYLAPLGERAVKSFAQRLGATAYAQRVQTISRASQVEISKATGLPPAKIDVIYGGVDEAFQPLASAEKGQPVLARLGVTGPYIFSVSGVHHTKNLEGLLTAYSLLPADQRAHYSLVILLPLSPQTRRIIDAQLVNLNIQERVVLLNQVSQKELVILYNGASIVVHATFFEGLGLPILEAMRCGTPVIAANVSSMPEIAGQAVRLVDPHKPQEIALMMRQVLASQSLRAEMRERGLVQAEKFTWQGTAALVLDSYAQAGQVTTNALQRPFEPASGRSTAGRSKPLRLAFWSPFNPQPSGISDYSEALVAELGKLAEIDLYVDGYQPDNLPFFDSFPTFEAQAYPAIAHQRPYDLNIYQVGNNPLHSYIYRPLLNRPGIMTLHDFCLYHMLHAVFVKTGDLPGFWQEVAYCEGEASLPQVKKAYFAKQLDDYTLALNKRLVEASLGVVVHSRQSLEKLDQYETRPPSQVIPMGTLFLAEDGGRFGRRIRHLLRLPEDAFVFGMFGHVHPVKRLSTILSAFARLRQQCPQAVLFIMGAVSLPAREIMRPFRQNIQAAQAQGLYLHLMYANFDLMLMAMQAVDVGLNLRYPTAGETSSVLSFLLGQGKPTIVSDVGSFAEYPDACCPKVPVDEQEEETLFQQMLALLKNESHYRQAVQAAYSYSQDKTWPLIAQQYLDFIEEVLISKTDLRTTP